MNTTPKISGYTIVRNSTVLDYPFKESVRSILPLCDEFIINCGDSTDNTASLVSELQQEYPEKIRALHSVWTRENQQGGFQLKAQSDAALAQCKGDWCFYLQADEVVHEDDYPKILKAIQAAEKLPEVDGILFDYLHFYGNYSNQIRGRNWYRREVRLIKNGRNISSFRDAQGFRKNGKRVLALSSGARVFHYGYVRTSEGLRKKSFQMAQWWGEQPKDEPKHFRLKRHVGLRPFTATHPQTMKQRITLNHLYCDPTQEPRVWDKNEIKNALTLALESIVPIRIGEYRNYDIV